MVPVEGVAVIGAGSWGTALTRPLAEVLGLLGLERGWVVHGNGGMDELSLTGPSTVASLEEGRVEELEVTPEGAGLKPCTPSDLRGGTADENAEIIRKMFRGETGPKTDMVALNSGAVLYLCGRTGSLKEGVEAALDIMASGRAMERLEHLVETTSRLAGERDHDYS